VIRRQEINKGRYLPARGLALALLCLLSLKSIAGPAATDETSELELTNFAFATYLGSGFYSTGNLKLFVLRIPLSSELSETATEKAGLVLHYPVTVGVARIDDELNLPEIGDIIDVNNVATVSVVPGLEYGVPMAKNWYLGPFVDLGIARDFANNTNIGVGGIGAKSFINFDYDHGRLVIANRLLYAQQNNLESGISTHFSSFETGLEYSFPSGFRLGDSPVDFSFYFVNYHYIDDLVIGGPIEDRISLQNKNEAGFTFSLPKHDWLPDNSRLGFGVQVTRDSDFYRIVFGSPFF
jgi:hypothetical protein